MLELMEHVVKTKKLDVNALRFQAETWVEVYLIDGRSVVMFVPENDFHAHDLVSDKFNGNARLMERYRIENYRGNPPHYKMFLGDD